MSLSRDYSIESFPLRGNLKSCILHHNKAPVHRSLLVSNYLSKHHVSTLPQPARSPDLAPCDYLPMKNCFSWNDSQVAKKCSCEGLEKVTKRDV
ncbi:hypothetical protein AVEN_238827-1 [Araneus ventricosus]|uniref:Tc1-like transposase DDE domain-containing protein n=1 Tax=Araneus ventricosus TaxID=182803 RepID=A0A4Y2PDT3_ARAVE|nr:hypothetical protein AVEN_238827-1 [Araneus ventricosus]